MNRVIKSSKGASSILVILLLVVLVVFGVAALTTALSNVRLGQKTADWNDKYYAADAKANEMMAQIDEAAAVCWSSNICYSGDNDPVLDEFLEKLDFDVIIEGDNNVEYLSYEAWEEDVGISVVLSYDTMNGSFTVKQYKAVHK